MLLVPKLIDDLSLPQYTVLHKARGVLIDKGCVCLRVPELIFGSSDYEARLSAISCLHRGGPEDPA